MGPPVHHKYQKFYIQLKVAETHSSRQISERPYCFNSLLKVHQKMIDWMQPASNLTG